MEKKFGLIGSSVSHSFSKSFFDEKFFREGLRDYHYDLYPLATVEELKKLLDENPELYGLNVTVPYKEQVMKLLTDIDSDAKKIGAVNVIKIQNGTLKGFNTDSDAFYETVEKWFPSIENASALVLGSGGSSKAVRQALKKLNIPYKVVSRKSTDGDYSYEDLEKDGQPISSATLIINTTPLGMSPNSNAMPPINYELINSKHYVYDLIYNPARTMFLQKSEMRGATIKNGLEMLHIQAEKAWAIWNN
jgi:shikimate dehydrogenase